MLYLSKLDLVRLMLPKVLILIAVGAAVVGVASAQEGTLPSSSREEIVLLRRIAAAEERQARAMEDIARAVERLR